MEAQASKSPHPLMWAAGIALIVFCGAGVGAMMGWIPNSLGKPDDSVPAQLVKSSANTHPAQVAPRAARPAPASTPAPAAAVVAARCADCGVVQSVHEIETKGEGSGVGVVGGAVVGGVLGNQVGSGTTKKVMTAVGAVGGAVAGNEIEKRVRSTKSYEVTVRFEDGSSRVITEANTSTWRAGDKVKVVNNVIQSNA
jgi:outer membrane lipoprotein SlyB